MSLPCLAALFRLGAGLASMPVPFLGESFTLGWAHSRKLFISTVPIFGAGANNIDTGLLAETFLWILAFIALVIAGLVIVLKIRKNERNATMGNFGMDDHSDNFRKLYEHKLITFAEFETIRKNLRDRQMERYVQMDEEKSQAILRGQGKKERGWKPMSEHEKQDRLNAMLSAMDRRK